ncbi:MAG: HDOD domain-containing protein [Dechloromonas sp.]|uniref:HDOD domain-containing protein n=1 Tax=Candidatus Dechloromonas phosphorivorans TaxID=2899244 RepID=A0A935MXD1_9RHOO|nr:HDOD domain-containing protein [Candidatus Dechloromonas phosphorivorans]
MAPPALAGVALIKLQAAAQDDNAGIREFAKAVESDPAVCGALMRVANSAVLRPPRKSTTVEQAISVIGFRVRWLSPPAYA